MTLTAKLAASSMALVGVNADQSGNAEKPHRCQRREASLMVMAIVPEQPGATTRVLNPAPPRRVTCYRVC